MSGIRFQDSSLVKIVTEGKDITLSFENAYVDGVLRFADLQLRSVTGIVCDGEPLERLQVIFDDGEVLELSILEGGMSMLIAWSDFKRRFEETHFYQLNCQSVVTKIGSVSLDNPSAV